MYIVHVGPTTVSINSLITFYTLEEKNCETEIGLCSP